MTMSRAEEHWTDREPILKLCAAVLEDNARVLRNDQRPSRLVEELRWLMSDDRRGPFAFRNVCDVLHRDPAEVRRRVLRARHFPLWMLSSATTASRVNADGLEPSLRWPRVVDADGAGPVGADGPR